MAGPGRLLRLGPRVWWVYLAVDTPKTVDQLSADAGIVRSSIKKHLRRLEREGLVRQTQERGRLVRPRDAIAPESGRRWWPF